MKAPLVRGLVVGVVVALVVAAVAASMGAVVVALWFDPEAEALDLEGGPAVVAILALLGLGAAVPVGLVAGVWAGWSRLALLRRRAGRLAAPGGNSVVVRRKRAPFLQVAALLLVGASIASGMVGLGPFAFVFFVAGVGLLLGVFVFRRRPGRTVAQLARYASRWSGPVGGDLLQVPSDGSWTPALVAGVRAGPDGRALAARAREVGLWAGSRGWDAGEPGMIDLPQEMPLLVPSGLPAWQVDNVVEVPQPDGSPVVVMDVDGFSGSQVNGRWRGQVWPSSVAWAEFPAEHALVASPRSWRDVGTWREVGDAKRVGEPAFDRVFSVAATDHAWALRVLNPAVMAELVRLAPALLVVDRGRVAVQVQGVWVEGSELDGFVALLAKLRFSIREAQSL